MLREFLIAFSFFFTITASFADKALFQSYGTISTTDASYVKIAAAHGLALRVVTGHKADWPGILLPAPGGHWDLSPYAEVIVPVKNTGSNSVTISCRVDNAGADGIDHCANGELTLAPGKESQLHVGLKRTSGDKLGGALFGMKGYPVMSGGQGMLDPANVIQVLIFVRKPEQDHSFEIGNLTAVGHYTSPTAWTSDAMPFFPFIDTFGQYSHKDWPGKTQSPADLAKKRSAEAMELAKFPGPKDWDIYGGSRTGPQLSATGYFRTEKVKGKWWLVDPDGHIFFSHGIDCVGFDESTPISGRDNWFQDFPGRQSQFEQFLSKQRGLMGHYAGQTPECFSFAGANLLRKYGPDWKAIYPRVVQGRLRSWGVNTIGNWSDPRFVAMHLTAYTDSIHSGGARLIAGSDGYWGKFPDVFDPSLADQLQRSMREHERTSVGDPWCIGYFSDNEMSWGDETSIALAALKSGVDQPAKNVFIADLRAKYGAIEKLNGAWGTQFVSWDAMLEQPITLDAARARVDLTAFYTKAAEQYFRLARAAIKAVAPHQLYLGCRFAWGNALTAAAAAKYCDVVSYNVYKHSLADFKFSGGADVPLLIGEFHFGALDRGLFHQGLVPVPDQAARANAYKEYVESALHHPQFVGCHWFQYRDEPVIGRALDEENYQIGFVDVADTPYAETIAACRAVGYQLYKH